MPKVTRAAKFRLEKKTSAPREHASTQKLSRGQRKRQAKREQYLRKERMILSSLKLKKAEEQKKRIDGLDAMKEALLDTMKQNDRSPATEPRVERTIVRSNKSRKRLLATELNQMNLVLQHPAYKTDPFATMQQHLKNTMAEKQRRSKGKAKRQGW